MYTLAVGSDARHPYNIEKRVGLAERPCSNHLAVERKRYLVKRLRRPGGNRHVDRASRGDNLRVGWSDDQRAQYVGRRRGDCDGRGRLAAGTMAVQVAGAALRAWRGADLPAVECHRQTSTHGQIREQAAQRRIIVERALGRLVGIAGAAKAGALEVLVDRGAGV